MDRGHKRTEQVINKIEGRLRAEYEQAAKEVEETLKDYMERFALKDKKWQEWVKDGKRTQEQYDAWRKQQLMQGERWKQLKNQLANDMVNTTSAARDIVQSYMPEVYEINANYALYQVEVGGGYTLPSSLTLYNREAIARLVKDEPDLMPMGKSVLGDIARGKAQRWERQKVQSIMMQGILQGKSNVRIAQDIAENLANGDFKASMRYARTMSTNAQNGGRYGAYRRLEENGVPLTLQWEATLDMRTRHEHRMMHGQRRNVNQPFEVDGVEILYPAWLGMGDYKVPPDMIWNCFVGDTNVATDSEIQKSYKHKYSGELITINTASGINFTCTPNHPILTPRGWVAAALLNKGDDLLVTSGGDGAIFSGNGNVNHVHSTMKALHETLLDFGGVIQSPMSNFNFHGDIPTSDVEIVCKEGELGVNLDTRIANSINKSLLKNPDTLSSGKGHFMSRFGGIDVSTLGFVSRIRKALSLLGGGVCHTDKHCFGSVAGGDSCISEYSINDLPAMTNIRSELLNGLAGKVFVDNVVAVDRKPSGLSCHVYNLQTENGYYFVGNSITRNGETYNGNMVIVKNCRCTLLAFIKGFEHDALKTSERMEGLSYEDWLNAKERPDPITKQRDIGEMMRMRYIREYREFEKKTFGEQVNGIIDKARKSPEGITTETIRKVGKKFAKEVNNKYLAPMNENLKKAQEEFERVDAPLKSLRDERRTLSGILRGLADPSEYGYSDKLEVARRKREIDNQIGALLYSDEYDRAQRALWAAQDKLRDIKAHIAYMKLKIGEVREVGLGEYGNKKNSQNVTAHLLNSRSPMRKVVEQAYDCYPTEWVGRSIQRGVLSPKKVDRGYYSDWDQVIAISGNGNEKSLTTAIHELAHRFERAVPNVREQEKEFYDRRTAGEELEWLGGNYGKNEVTRRDQFIHAYMGKDYGGHAYELVSMGFQYAFTDPAELAKDPDMQEWILGMLLTL